MIELVLLLIVVILLITVSSSSSGGGSSSNYNGYSNSNSNSNNNNDYSDKSEQLYYRLPYGSMYGPFTSLQIYQWWEQGHLDNDTLLSADGQDDWIRVDSYFKHSQFETHSHVYIPNEKNSNEIIDRQGVKQQDESSQGLNNDIRSNSDSYNQYDQYQHQGYDSNPYNNPNQYQEQDQNQYPQYQYTNQYSNQYPNQYPDQYPDQYSDQYANQYPNQYANQYPNQYPGQYNDNGRVAAFRKLESLKEKVKLFRKKTSDLLGTLKEKAISTAISTTDRMLDISSSISTDGVSSLLNRQKINIEMKGDNNSSGGLSAESINNDYNANVSANEKGMNEWNTNDSYDTQEKQSNDIKNTYHDNFNANNDWDHPDNVDKETDNWDTDESTRSNEKEGFLHKVKLPSIPIPSFSSSKGNSDDVDYRDNMDIGFNEKYQEEAPSYRNDAKNFDTDDKDFKISVKSLGVSDRDWLEVDNDRYLDHLKPPTKLLSSAVSTVFSPLSFVLTRFFPSIVISSYTNAMTMLPTVFPELLLYFVVLVVQEILKPINIILGISFFKFISSSEVSKLNQFTMFSDNVSSDYIKIDPIDSSIGASIIPTLTNKMFNHFPISKIQYYLKQLSSSFLRYRESITSNNLGLAFMITSISYVLIWTIVIPAVGDSASSKLDSNKSVTSSTSSYQWDFLTSSTSMMSPFGWIISLSLLTLMLKDTFTFNTRLLFVATSMFAIIEMFNIKNDAAVRSEQSSSKTSGSTSYATYIDHVLSSNKLEDIKRWGLLSYIGSIKSRESQSRPKEYENMSSSSISISSSSSSSSSSRGVFRIMRQSLCTLTLGFMTTLAISHDDKFIEKLCSMTRNLSFSHDNEVLNNIAQGVLMFVSKVVTDACTVNSNVLSAVVMAAPLYLWVEFLNKSNHNRKAIRRIDDFLETGASTKADRLHDEFESSSGWTNDGPNKGAGIQIENASVVGEDNNILIADTTINFEPGKINIIIGQVDPKKNRILSSIWGDNNLRLTKGKVLVHGRDLREWNRQALRSRMSYLRDREPEISLEAGVLSGLQPTATGKELNDQIRALDLSGARSVLNSLPQGPMTLIRNNEEPIPSSVTLTNDEWRCLGLSRALCNMDKDIILLDSPCNQMSEVEEKEFYFKLRKLLRQDQVIVTTSSRFSSAYNADNIVILDKNQVSQGAANDPSILSTIKENLNNYLVN